MHAPATPLKPLSSLQLSPDEAKILTWLRKSAWEPQSNARDPIPYRTKVPEFYGGVRLYRMQAGGSGGSQQPLDLFIKKLQFQGVIGKQDMYPVTEQAGNRYLSLRKTDLDNLGIGADDEDDE